MPIRIFDTLSQGLKPIKGKKIKMFVCGPTVYDLIHIGNARTYLVFDMFARYLRSAGVDVFYLQNITDVDNKIIARATQENSDSKTIAAKYQKIYLKDIKTLGISSVDRYAQATKYIPEIVKQIKKLVRKGHVYKIDGDGYYFDVTTFPEYGKLARRTLAQAEDGVSRIDESVLKRHKADFCVWKFSRSADSRGLNADKRRQKFKIIGGEPSWNTELGWGRPGWHIEDTAITEHFFGPQYDIHGGGVDLKFPHHEAEIAQQESASGKKPFVKIWMHAGALTVNGKKMSKSLGNFVVFQDFLKKYTADVLRMMVLTHHYRSPMDYTEKSAEEAEAALDSIKIFLAKTGMAMKRAGKMKKSSQSFYSSRSFKEKLSNDFNTPEALAVVFDAINRANKTMQVLDKKSLKEAADFVKKSIGLFGISLKLPEIPLKIRKMAAEREELRSNKQFPQSDALRKEIEGLGYITEDTPWGQLIWPSRQPK